MGDLGWFMAGFTACAFLGIILRALAANIGSSQIGRAEDERYWRHYAEGLEANYHEEQVRKEAE